MCVRLLIVLSNSGKGLGKKEDGIDKALKPKLKFDTSGLGHDPGEQFTNKWWESAYNSAVNNIDVKNKKSEVKIKTNAEIEITTKKTMVWLKETNDQSDDDSNSEAVASTAPSTDPVPTIVQLTDEQLFAACGGLTAHKAARHGHKLSGKLKRLQEQEKELGEMETPDKKKKKRSDPVELESRPSEEIPHISDVHLERKKKKKDASYKNDQDTDPNSCEIEATHISNANKKKKKNKDKPVYEENSTLETPSETIKQKKKKKRS